MTRDPGSRSPSEVITRLPFDHLSQPISDPEQTLQVQSKGKGNVNPDQHLISQRRQAGGGTDDGRNDVALKGLPSEVVGVGVQELGHDTKSSKLSSSDRSDPCGWCRCKGGGRRNVNNPRLMLYTASSVQGSRLTGVLVTRRVWMIQSVKIEAGIDSRSEKMSWWWLEGMMVEV